MSMLLSLPLPSCARLSRSSLRIRPERPCLRAAAGKMESFQAPCSPVREFPYLPVPHRRLMLGLLSTIDDRLGPHLLPSYVPAEVLSFTNPTATSHGTFDFRSGRRGSAVDLILESWIHCEAPAFDVSVLYAYLNASTDAPHLILELVQSRPTSVMLFMDLLPRKDLILHQNYLNEFYQDTNLDEQRQILVNLPQAKLFCSSSLYIRSLFSPTAITINIDCGEDGRCTMEEIMQGPVSTAANEVLRVWLDKCACSSKQLEETERDQLVRRDDSIKRKAVEIDLSESYPRIFGPDVASRVLGVIRKAYGI